MSALTGFVNSAGIDIGSVLVEKTYLNDRYPNLLDSFSANKQPTIWGWGRANAIGDGTTSTKTSPIIINNYTDWASIFAGADANYGIKIDGTLWMWGSNDGGQLGNGGSTSANVLFPTQYGTATNWKNIAAPKIFGNAGAAITTDGLLFTWGRNTDCEIGNGRTYTGSSSTYNGMYQVPGTTWAKVSCGSGFKVAIKTDGTLWVVGTDGTYPETGKLGIPALAGSQVNVFTQVGTDANWKDVSCTNTSAAAIKTDGTLWTWGYNGNGQLGNGLSGAGFNRNYPLQVGTSTWKQVSGGLGHFCAIKSDGTLWCWGYNPYGQVGDGTTALERTIPTQVPGYWRQVSAGVNTTTAIKTDGTLWTWGYNGNSWYTLGNGSPSTNSISPVQTLAGSSNWKQVACGGYYTLALRDNMTDVFGNAV